MERSTGTQRAIRCLCLLLALASAQTVLASDHLDLNRGEVLTVTGISLASNIATIVELGFGDQDMMLTYQFPWWLYATVATHHLPMYALDPWKAFTYTATEAVLFGAHLATHQLPLLTSVPFSLLAYNEFYATYDIYSTARNQSSADVYQDEWQSYSRLDLALSPFSREALTDPLFLATVLSTSAIQITKAVRSDTAIWSTGQTWVDGKRLAPVLAVPYMLTANWLIYSATAIGEESLYRGVVYEELRTSFGPLWGKIADMLLFPIIHIPTDLARGKTWAQIGIQLGIRMTTTLLLDWAYDRGGLPLSTAMHTWFNYVAKTSDWLGTGGVPAEL